MVTSLPVTSVTLSLRFARPSLPFRNVNFHSFAQFGQNFATPWHILACRSGTSLSLTSPNFVSIPPPELQTSTASVTNKPTQYASIRVTILMKLRSPRFVIRLRFWIRLQKSCIFMQQTFDSYGGNPRCGAPPGFWCNPSSRGLATRTWVQACLTCTLQSFVPFAWKRFQNTDQSTRQLHTFVFRPFRGIGAHKHLQAWASFVWTAVIGNKSPKRWITIYFSMIFAFSFYSLGASRKRPKKVWWDFNGPTSAQGRWPKRR